MKLVKIAKNGLKRVKIGDFDQLHEAYLLIHKESEEVPFKFLVEDCKYYNFVIGTENSLSSFGGLINCPK